MPIDPVFAGILLAVVGFVLVLYFLLRRTITGFREGVESGYDEDR